MYRYPYVMALCANQSVVLRTHSQCAGICRECVDLLKELNAPVKHIILTTHAYEHKIFIAPFQRRFPEAKVYVPPK